MGATSPYYTGRPTVHPASNFNPGQDADDLRKAMRGLGEFEICSLFNGISTQ